MKKKKSIATIIMLAMLAGIIVGIILNGFADTPFVKTVLTGFIFKLGGMGFTYMISMIVVPIVLFSLIVGTSDMGDVVRLGRIGTKTIGWYLATTTVAIIIGLTISLMIKPGLGFDLTNYAQTIESYKAKSGSPALVDVLLNIIPKNPFKALSEGVMLQVIFFAMMIGTALTILGEKTSSIRKVFVEGNEVVMQIVWIVMKAAPFGVFCLTADTFTRLGIAAFKPLAIYMITVVIALFIHAIVVYGSLLTAVAKLNPIQFLKNFAPAISVAFSTASSNATLPVALDSVTNRCGVHKDISSFTIPLGATINMDGSAISMSCQALFLAQAYGIELTVLQLAMIVVTATLASIGNAGVPSASLILLSAILMQIGVPVEAVGILLGVDRILSMTRTTINVSGDAIVSIIVAKSEGLFDIDIFKKKNVIKEAV